MTTWGQLIAIFYVWFDIKNLATVSIVNKYLTWHRPIWPQPNGEFQTLQGLIWMVSTVHMPTEATIQHYLGTNENYNLSSKKWERISPILNRAALSIQLRIKINMEQNFNMTFSLIITLR